MFHEPVAAFESEDKEFDVNHYTGLLQEVKNTSNVLSFFFITEEGKKEH